MDVIWLDENLCEKGILKDAVLDSEIGENNDFTLTVPKTKYSDLAGAFVYPQGAFEFGGKIMSCVSNDKEGFVTFYGKTWLGILSLYEYLSFIYSYHYPAVDEFEKYINNVLALSLIYRKYVGNTDFVIDKDPVKPDFGGGVLSMLDVFNDLYRQFGLIPTVFPTYSEQDETSNKIVVNIGAREPLTYYDFDRDDDSIHIEVEKQFQPVTVIRIGYYDDNNTLQSKYIGVDSDGVWHEGSIYIWGFKARQAALIVDKEVFENTDWDEIIKTVQVKDSANVSVAGDLMPSVGDMVYGRDPTTGIECVEAVTSKTLHLSEGTPIFGFET